jgi:predicted dehydrogenase
MMPQKVRVGVVSTSWWADKMFLPALKSHAQADVVAICGRDRKRAEEMAGKYAVPGVFADYRKMIEQVGLDAVVVGVPDDLHYEVTMQALHAGLHVLCEKPMAANAQQALEMAEKAEAAGVKHMVLFTFRWMPYFQYLHDLVDQGYIGRFYHCEFRFAADYGRSHEYMWRFDRKRANGIVGDLGSHVIDMARWLVGDITSISAQLGVFVDRVGADGGSIDPANDCALLLAKFANGAHGVIQASCVAHLADRGIKLQVKLYGEAGTLEVDVPFFGPEDGAVVRGARSQEKQFQVMEVPRSYWGNADPYDPSTIFTKNSAGSRLFIDGILANRSVYPSFHDGYRAQQIVDAAIASHESGCAVAIAI